jgi:uncharacterized integral membrane protein
MKLPQMIRNLWIYRRLFGLAVLLGVALFFLASNREPVKVTFPFLGEIDSTSGIVMLASATMGGIGCWLVMSFRKALQEAKAAKSRSPAVGRATRGASSGTSGTETETKGSQPHNGRDPGKEAEG